MKKLIALQDINLEIEAGEFISLIGPSGCGKSTLMRLVGDLLQPSSGELLVNGKPPAIKRGWTATTAWSFRRRRFMSGAA